MLNAGAVLVVFFLLFIITRPSVSSPHSQFFSPIPCLNREKKGKDYNNFLFYSCRGMIPIHPMNLM